MTKQPKPKQSKTPKHPGGAPTKYDSKYCEAIIKFFSQECIKEINEVVEGKNWSKETVRYEPIFFPTFEEFAAKEIGVHVDTLHEWKKTHKEFSEAYSRAKDIQKGVLLRFATLGKFNSNFAQFLAINNMGMESKNKVEATQEITHKFEDLTDEQLEQAIKDRQNRLS